MHRRPSSESMPVARRNSFSRNVSATIDQFRSALDDARREGSTVQNAPATSPRKVASSPQLIPSNPSSPVRHNTLDFGIDFGRRQHISMQQHRTASSAAAATAAAIATALDDSAVRSNALDSDDDSDDVSDVREIDLSVDSPDYSDVESSSSSRAPSPVNKTAHECSQQVQPTAQDSSSINAVEPEPFKTRAKSISDDLPDWLQDRPLLQAANPQSAAQQIEHDIRDALAAAASSVARENDRRDRFERALYNAAHPVATTLSKQSDLPVATTVDLPTSASLAPTLEPITSPPELLLLIEVVIGEGRSETIEVHVGDAPHALAAQFAATHALKSESVPKLTQLIEDELAALSLDDDRELVSEDAPPIPATIADEHAAATQHHQQWPELTVQPPPAVVQPPVASLLDYNQQHQQWQTELPPPPPYTDVHEHFDTDLMRATYNGADSDSERLEREHSRAMNYQSLLAKYGHYSQHSNKVDPSPTTAAATYDRGLALAKAAADRSAALPTNDALTFRNIQLAEHTRRHTLSGNATSKTKSKPNAPAPVFDRLYALAASKDKWIRRAQNAKQRELEHAQAQRTVAIAAKSRALSARSRSSTGTSGYANIGERLYDDARADQAKKERLRAQRAVDREHEIDWMCPKCASVNAHSDAVCKNVVAAVATSGSVNAVDMPPRALCGQRKPAELFRPTLLAAAGAHSKAHAVRVASQRRARTEQAIEDAFKQTCPFRPTINSVSEELVRERLELDAEEAGETPSGPVRRKDPHVALYEDAAAVRAHRQAAEESYYQQFPFKPDIGVNALWVSSGSDDVVERLAVSKYHELEQKRAALLAKYAPDRDPESGRAFFTPATGRAPAFSRNARSLPIGDFLHDAHREQLAAHRRLLQTSLRELQQQQTRGFVSATSRQALAVRKARTVRRLFDALLNVSTLAPDDAGSIDSVGPAEAVVTPALVQIELLPPAVAQVVPIVFAFANNAPFTAAQLDGFVDRLVTDVPGFTYTQVLFLAEHLSDGKSSRGSNSTHNSTHSPKLGDNDSATNDLTFSPTIDRNSDAIAKKHGRAPSTKVFDALHQYCAHYSDRKAQVAKQQQREFERLHPFQPHLVAKATSTRLAAGFYDKLTQQQKEVGTMDNSSNSSPVLMTAAMNARPCVRPIGRNDNAAATPDTNSSASSQVCDDMAQLAGSDDDADLTSRVLAALEEVPSTQSAVAASSSHAATKLLLARDDDNATELVRLPESTALATS